VQSFHPEELLLLITANMNGSFHPKHSMNKKADKFLDEIALHFLELASTALSTIKEINPEYSSL
jgi:hypothetical protein